MQQSVGSAILNGLRRAMVATSLDGLIVPTSDAHNSEYVASRLKYRAFVTNFYGSAGTCLITKDLALLWTDSRYWLEAEGSLYPGWTLMKDGAPGVLPLDEWIESNLGGRRAAIGVDANVVTVATWEKWTKRFQPIHCGGVVAPALIASLPQEVSSAMLSLPALPDTSLPHDGYVFPRPSRFDGCTSGEKVRAVCQAIRDQHSTVSEAVDFLVVSALDEVAWLTNMRACCEVPYNPVFYAFALVDVRKEQVVVFTDSSRWSTDALAALSPEVFPPGSAMQPYDALTTTPLQQLQGKVVLLDENLSSWGLAEALTSVHQATTKRVALGPIALLKSKKHPVEIQGFRDCHNRDGVALTRYLAWLTAQIRANAVVDEWRGAQVLASYRQQEAHFVQLSFETISSSGANGAIIHYAPPQDGTAPAIRPDALYLVDSGAQYYDGTTDVTRTICFGVPTEEEREAYTLVLKGHIAIQRCVWPKGTTGHRIDVLARQALWSMGLNYGHGTGHGVGSFLNVHEGPQGIHTRPTASGATLEATMILSNEPGFYKDGAFGIRIENLEVVVPAVTKYNSTGGYLTFDTLTMAPLCRDLINVSMLTAEEIAWVNRYHARVVDVLRPLLLEKAEDRDVSVPYLEYHCAAI